MVDVLSPLLVGLEGQVLEVEFVFVGKGGQDSVVRVYITAVALRGGLRLPVDVGGLVLGHVSGGALLSLVLIDGGDFLLHNP